MLRVRVLGELELDLDGTPLPPPASRRARVLLGFMALHPGPHPRAGLAARFWPDVLDESARTSLRGALADVRRALGPAADEHLVATRSAAGMVGVETDAAGFARLTEAGSDAGALALCRGELLAGLDGDGWLLAARDEQREAHAAVLSRLAAAADAAGDLEAAVRHTRARIALDPLSEEAHRELMARLATAGDRAAALAAYGRLADRLRAELRIAPSAPTRELAEALRRGDIPPAATAAAGVAAGAAGAATAAGGGAAPRAALPLPRRLDARRARSPFVGRRAELERLRAAVAAVRDGERRLLAIGGDPGIGKTRLLAELAGAEHAAGAAVLYGRCPEEAVAPYQPFAEALRPLAGAEPLLGATEPGPGDAAGARLRQFEAVAAALADAPGSPVLLALDDLHWADRPSLLLLAHLLRDLRPGRLVVAGTYREGELGRRHPLARALADLRRDRLVERVALGGLDGGAAAGLIAGWFGADASASLSGAVLEETGGNPFFIEEVLRHLLESGALSTADGRWRLSRPVRELGVPESVREVIGRRLDRLGEASGEVLETAAVIGPEFDLAVLDGACAAPRDTVLDALEAAADANLIRAVPDRPGRWSFAHALIREALHDELSSLRRTRLHARVAEALAGHDEARLAELSHHGFEAAALVGPERAATWAQSAGDAALAQLAYEEAAAHYERALQALELAGGEAPVGSRDAPAALERAGGEAPARRRGRLLLALADARGRAGDPQADDACRATAAHARATGDAELLGRAALAAGGVGVAIVGLDEQRVALLEEALAALGDGSPGLRARLLARLAIALYYAPGRTRSGELSALAIAAAREAGDPDALLAALNARHVALWHPDGLAERLRVADEMLALAARHGREEARLQACNWRCVDLWEAGDLDGFRAEAAEHELLADALRLPAFRWYATHWRAALAALAGEREEALRLAAEAGAAGTRAGDPNGELFLGMLRFQLDFYAHEFSDEMLAFLEHQMRNHVASAAYASSCCWVYAERGRTGEARRLLDELAPDDFAALAWDANWFASLHELGEATALLGDAERAATLYPQLLPYAGRRLVAGRATIDCGSADYTLGRLAATAGRATEAVAHLEAALAADAGIRARPLLVRTRARLAELLAAGGETARARELAAEAVAEAAALGIPRAVPAAVAALQHDRGRPVGRPRRIR